MAEDIGDALWHSAGTRIRARVGQATWDSWFRTVRVASVEPDRVIVLAATKFMKDWLRNNYQQLIEQELRRDLPHLKEVVIEASADAPGTGNRNGKATPLAAGTKPAVPSAPALPEDVTQRLDPSLTFENFVVGKTNELAYAAARRVAEAKTVAFNPLFLYSGSGLGKTHLMQAIAWHIRESNPSRRVMYLTSEGFMYHFIRAVRFKDTMSFKEKFRAIDVLLIDDLQFLTDKNATQEEFFHTFNALVDGKHQIVVSADRSPSDLSDMEERVRSRLGWGLVADIHQTTFELRVGILEQKAASYPGITVPDDVIGFLAHRITSNIRELEGALKKIIFHHELVGRAITLDLAQEVLADLLRTSARKISIEDIQLKVAEHFAIKITDLSSNRRHQAIARPRQVAMYLSKRLTTQSLPAIGRRFGNRDHTTILHGVRRIEELMRSDTTLAEDVRLLEAALSDPSRRL